MAAAIASMAQVVVVAEQVWASLAGHRHASFSAVVVGRSVVQNAYRSPLAAIALTIRAHRVQMESKAKKEKNDMRLAVEATPIPPSPEEIQARAYIDAQYTPEVRAIRERAVLAAAERAKESHPDPTSPGIREIEAEIAYERALPEKIAALKERLAEMKASVTASDIT